MWRFSPPQLEVFGMRKLTSTLVAAVALVALPHLALAQRTRAAAGGAKNEIGVDLGAQYSHIGSGCAADCGGLRLRTPVGIPPGFMANGLPAFEPRVSLNHASGSGYPRPTLSFESHSNHIYS